MFKPNRMLLVVATGFAALAAASILTQVGPNEQRPVTAERVEPFKLMSTAKDMPVQVVHEPY